ncbi:unnamed protein product [Lepeophtheirus salmonis]|uniref:(salmon louse) hypothetical protein n=1 Tax=Lepeophtheirus salmonis TaxID=72036 RepID=A0A7R8CVL7_LEPSM|nr:unnamed protein product [Lepeophtheirus salmonis]CAF2945914.1 unnamed protein product [Lepeophtheirus salmonis]
MRIASSKEELDNCLALTPSSLEFVDDSPRAIDQCNGATPSMNPHSSHIGGSQPPPFSHSGLHRGNHCPRWSTPQEKQVCLLKHGLTYLGFRVSQGGKSIDPELIRPVVEFPTPTTSSMVNSFPGSLVDPEPIIPPDTADELM